ncbi:hypothetical protein EMCRGX_G024932 [Ephydatia muelleri]
MIGENFQGEVALLSRLWWGGATRSSLVLMPDLNEKVLQLLEDNHSAVKLHVGRDKGGNTTDQNEFPNSQTQYTCLLLPNSNDAITNLHSALDHFRDQLPQCMEYVLIV